MQGDAPTKEKLDEISLDLIDESPSNPRKHFDAAKLAELAADIASNGLTQPVVVRARDGGRFELVVGARRTRASKMAGRTAVLAIVRDIGDRATLEVQLSENANRQDVHPLEEADGYAQLLDVHHATVDEVAAKVGKPAGYVRHRLQYRALCAAGRDAFFAGKLTPHTALLVARIPVESLQVQAVKDITSARWNEGEPMSPREAAHHIQGLYMLRLADAPFDRGDTALVPSAGACTNCPKRTGNQAELFADVDSPDVCIDPTCFAEKKDAHWKIVADAAKEKGHKVLSAKDAKEVFSHGGRVAYDADFVDLAEKPYQFGGKKTYKGLVGKDHLPPVTVARDELGNVHELVKKDDLKRAMKSAGVTKAAPSNPVEAELREKKLRNRLVIDRAIASIVPAAEARKPDLALWQFVADALLTSGYDAVKVVEKRRGIFDEKAGGGARLKKALGTMKEPQVRALVVELIATKASVYASFGEDFRDACKLFGVDLKKLEAAVAAERKAAKKAKGKKGAKGKGKPARARRPAEDEGEDSDEEGDEPELGEDLGDDDAPEDETETRVWVAMAAWDALAVEARVHLEEPIVGTEVGWFEIDDYMSAMVPGAELLEALRSECKARGVALHEGEERPAAEAPPAAPEPPAEVPCTEDPAALSLPGRWVVVSLFAAKWTRLRDSEKRDDVGAYMKGTPGDHQTRLYDPDGEMVAWWPDGPRPPAIVAADGDAPGVDRGVMLYLHDAAWQGLPAASQAKVQAPTAGVSVLNIRPMNATHRELGPMKASEAALVRAAAAGVGLEVFDAPPPAAAAPALRVIIVSTAGDDWKGARKGLAAWDSKKTPGAGFTAGGSAEPLAMLYTPAVDSADVSTLLSRYQKAGRLVLDLGVVPGADLEAHDPGQRVVREQWNAAHSGARVSVPEAPKAPAKKARAKKAVA